MRWLAGGGRHTVQQSVHRGSTNSRIMDSLDLPGASAQFYPRA
ncbi:unnamed protein product, partial [Ectocarpus sp. 8 AP-2014]